MEFTFETNYNKESLTTMAKVLRKTVRKKRNRRTRVFGCIVIALALLLVIPFGDEKFTFDLSTVITIAAVAVMIVVLIWEDNINGIVARNRLMKGVIGATCVFTESGYTSNLDLGKTEWRYENIGTIAETGNFFVFIFDQSHAQLYDKRTLIGGTADKFRDFIEDKTGKKVQQI